MILKTGDRICQIDNPKITGAVVGGGRFGKESEVMVRWDSVYYYSEFPIHFLNVNIFVNSQNWNGY